MMDDVDIPHFGFPCEPNLPARAPFPAFLIPLYLEVDNDMVSFVNTLAIKN